jgi:endonuclease III related protein
MKDRTLYKIYSELFTAFGPQHWWPGETAFEVAVGAILTQNTNWGNVEKAIGNLKKEGLLDAGHLRRMTARQLAGLIRPAGYFNIKAARLKNFIELLATRYGGSMRKMKAEDETTVRERLLSVNGIGPETADSIILYALGKPVFVIDAYTKRVLSRHGIMEHDSSYDDFQGLFHSALERDPVLYNEFHALFVRLAKENCRTKPICEGCPLEGM